MPVGAEAAGYGGSALAYAGGRMSGYDVGDADLFETTTTRQQLVETTRGARVRRTTVHLVQKCGSLGYAVKVTVH